MNIITQLGKIAADKDKEFVKAFKENIECIFEETHTLIRNLIMKRKVVVLKSVREALLAEARRITPNRATISSGRRKNEKNTICDDIIRLGPYSFIATDKQIPDTNTLEEPAAADAGNTALATDAPSSSEVPPTETDIAASGGTECVHASSMEDMKQKITKLETEVASLKSQLARSADENKHIDSRLKKIEDWTNVFLMDELNISEILSPKSSVTTNNDQPNLTLYVAGIRWLSGQRVEEFLELGTEQHGLLPSEGSIPAVRRRFLRSRSPRTQPPEDESITWSDPPISESQGNIYTLYLSS